MKEWHGNGKRLSYKEVGEGKPLLVLHGTGYDHRSMERLLEPVFEGRPGWRRLYVDLPGMGETPAAGFTNSAEIVDALLAFLDERAPGERAALTGYSFGGYLLRGIAGLRGVALAGLFFLCPVVGRQRTNLPELRPDPPGEELLAAMTPDEARRFAGKTVTPTLELLERFRACIFPAQDMADARFLTGLKRTGGYWLPEEQERGPEQLDVPVGIVCGRQDQIVGYSDAARLLDQFPHASYAVLDKAGHHAFLEKETLVRAHFLDWLDRMEAEKAR
ncbi:2-hydroxy-6-oxo-6-phenylhexa-2,4-dienoate hydrolase [Paenibacillus sp. J31TS4]|uniref:alpha/beta fold hydrolase n=1 Tax=Paenibacillus sp. J31TS4 TaxID=2807195 RepID=UPI001B22AC74|nr:alpha/beta hydrolase [Paenibacillus sp. J31TS4]GIP37693.1 2-hydroxy-6-oxo-6-phenylhexa-2,4-dienoate hydrolase [Paenibacillus sp. J31TS4]